MGQYTSKATQMIASYERSLRETKKLLTESFEEAVELISNLESILVVTGLGKSGLIGQKAAATLSSTGTRSVFVHPVEALHGDIGIVSHGTALLAISKSGSNEETIEFARQYRSVTDGKVITVTEPGTRLARLADIELHIPKLPEIDEWDLAPTTSGITTLTICDVLAICVQQRKGMTAENFAQFHPSGALGKRLLLHVRDLMIKDQALPIQNADTSFSDVIYEISSKGLGLVLLTEPSGEFFGMLTDGDIRRLTERHEPITNMTGRECFYASRRGGDLPSVQGGWTTPDTKAIDCLTEMRDKQITSLVILNDNLPIGVVRMQDLVAAGL